MIWPEIWVNISNTQSQQRTWETFPGWTTSMLADDITNDINRDYPGYCHVKDFFLEDPQLAGGFK